MAYRSFTIAYPLIVVLTLVGSRNIANLINYVWHWLTYLFFQLPPWGHPDPGRISEYCKLNQLRMAIAYRSFTIAYPLIVVLTEEGSRKIAYLINYRWQWRTYLFFQLPPWGNPDAVRISEYCILNQLQMALAYRSFTFGKG